MHVLFLIFKNKKIMKKNDIYCSENAIMNVQNIKDKSSEEYIYKNIFLCPLNRNDCVNSMDIFDDILIYGTIMGSVYLCRVDENNLKYKKPKNENNEIIPNFNLNKNNNFSKPKCAAKFNNKSIIDSDNNREIDEFEKKVKLEKINKEIPKVPAIKLQKLEGNNYNNENKINPDINLNIVGIPENKKINNNNISNESLKVIKELSSNNINKKEDYTQHNEIFTLKKKTSNTESEGEEDNLNFPRITTLILNASENISCVSFDTKDNVIISVGDLEIIKLEKISTFNIYDLNSRYDYTRIRNYSSEEEHIINCENTTCFLTSSNFLMINTVFEEYNSPIAMLQIPYQNKILNNLDIVKGTIEMFNFCVPFDFDGDKFLFLDYQTKNIRRICIFYTISEAQPFIHKIGQDFGHISHMRLLSNDKIFLCRKFTLCEIYKINENDKFILLEEWTHIGEEIIAVDIYISGTKISYNYINNNLNDIYNFQNNNDSEKVPSTRRAYENEEKKNGIKIKYNDKDHNHKKNLLMIDCNKSSNSSFRELQYNNKWNYKKKFKEEKYFSDNSSKNNNKKREEVEIYNKNKSKSKNKELNVNHKNDNELDQNNIYDDNILKIKTNGSVINKYMNSNNDSNNENKLFIITLDINGNLNLYSNKINKVLFNLYKIPNIDQQYKDEEFFSSGFPYFIIMNSIYFCISTDHGIFVIAKCKK